MRFSDTQYNNNPILPAHLRADIANIVDMDDMTNIDNIHTKDHWMLAPI